MLKLNITFIVYFLKKLINRKNHFLFLLNFYSSSFPKLNGFSVKVLFLLGFLYAQFNLSTQVEPTYNIPMLEKNTYASNNYLSIDNGQDYNGTAEVFDIYFDFDDSFYVLNPPEICDNGIDDDGDGLIDSNASDCPPVTGTSTDIPKTISASTATTVTSTLTISESGTITDVNLLNLDISHTYIDDIIVTLTSPNGTPVVLLNRPCRSENNILMDLDDEATSGSFPCPPTNGWAYRPANPLSAFDGEDINGTWTISVQDVYGAFDGGSLNGWGLEFSIDCNLIEICDNSIDDDGDGLVDCDDPDCTENAANMVCAAACQGNNMGFENDFTGWTRLGSPSITNDAYVGSKAAYFNANGERLRQTLTVDADSLYQLSYWAKGTNGGNGWIGIDLRFYDSAGETVGHLRIDNRAHSAWNHFMKFVVAPENAVTMELELGTSGSFVQMYIDEICFQKSSYAIPTTTQTGCEIYPMTEANSSFFIDKTSGSTDGWIVYDLLEGGVIKDNGNNSKTIYATVINGRWETAYPCGAIDGWEIELTIDDKQTWSEFGGLYNAVTYQGCADNHTNWDYWDIAGGTLTGIGCNAGLTYNVLGNAPGYRFQIGQSASQNSCNFSMAGWVEYDLNGTAELFDIYFDFDESCYIQDLPEICDNGIDDDGDGDIDGCDADCNPDANIINGCITVNTTGDESDTNPGDGKCLTVNCDCTLRAAIEEANALAGKDTICFNIPTTDVNYDGTSWKITPANLYEFISEAVFIDGYTQPGSVSATNSLNASLKIEVSGESLPTGGSIFQTIADGNKFAGMVINGYDVTIASAGISLQSDFNEVVGNYIGTNVAGTMAIPNGQGVICFGSGFNFIGDNTTAGRNIISGNNRNGISIETNGIIKANYNVIQGNYIGTNVSGTSAIGNGENGIDAGHSINGVITNNVISGNGNNGIEIEGITNDLSGNYSILSNLIGTDVMGTLAIPNTNNGIFLLNVTNSQIGSTSAPLTNVIHYNGGAGIAVVGDSSKQNIILGNSISDNGSIGIDLANGLVGDGVTNNDANDLDQGANDLLNFPELQGIAIVSGDIYYDFNLDLPTGDYRIEFFKNTSADPSNHGEGKNFIGSININHTGNGAEQFFGSFTPIESTTNGDYITLTTTQCTNTNCVSFIHTSEFSGYYIAERCLDLTSAGTIAGDESSCQNPFDPSPIISVVEASGGEGGPVYYQWQELTEGNSVWKDIVGATEKDYDPPAITAMTQYRRRALRAKCTVTWMASNIVTKMITDGVTANIVTAPTGQNGFLCGATAYEFEAAEAGIDANYIWDFGENANPRYETGKGPHLISFLPPTDSLPIVNEIILEVQNNSCTAYDTTNFSIHPVIYSTNVNYTNITACGESNGAIEMEAIGEKGICVRVSLDGGQTYQPDGQLTFNNLPQGTYNIVLNYCGMDCPNTYGLVIIEGPTEIIATNDEIYDACPGFLLRGNVTHNDKNISNAIYTVQTNPTKGSITMDANGTFEYTPSVYECGSDQFTYQVCNNITGCCASATVTLNFEDHLAPDLQNVPPDLTINCDEEIPLAPLVSAFDNCPAISIDKLETSTQGEEGCALYDYTITRTWVATDICGNTATDEQIIEVQDITAPNIYRIYTLPNGKKMVAGIMKNVSHRWKVIQLPIDFPTTPVIFTQLISNYSSAAVVRMRNITVSQFELKVQEEEANTGIREGESVAWIALEEGANLATYNMEAGKITTTDSYATINFSNNYDGNPAFFTTVQSILESDPVQVHTKDLTSNAVEVGLQEETSADTETTHIAEEIAYLAVDSLTYILNNKEEIIGEVGTVNMTTNIAVITSNNNYYNPVVIANYSNDNQTAPVLVNARILSNNTFQLELKGWDYQNINPADGKIAVMIIEGSLPLDISEACINGTDSIVLGVDLVAIDNCDNNVSINFSETTTYNNTDKIVEKTYVAIDECGNETRLVQSINCSGVALRTKAFLQGAAITSDSPLMRDDLRKQNLIPKEEPYTKLEGFGHFGTGGRESLDSVLLNITGENAIVDWVLLELRDKNNPSNIITTQSCLIQRDGDVVNAQGDSVIVFENVPVDDYYVSIKHRNHLAMYSLFSQKFGPSLIPYVDFTNSFTPVMGDIPGVEIEGKRAMWSGDLNGDAKIIFQGPQNDIFEIFLFILMDNHNQSFLTNFIGRGYTQRDFNMDGKIIYQGPNNDRSPILYHTVLEHPDNNAHITNFIVQTGVQKDSIIIEPEWTSTDICVNDYTQNGCDFDNDGLVNEADTDKDGDGVPDSLDVAIFDINSDSDGDGLVDYLEIDSDPLDACSPNPANANCIGIDVDNDGYFANYPPTHGLFDADDKEACFPDFTNSNCDCRDIDGDGKITVCHLPGTDYAQRITEEVSISTWLIHKEHGDVCGPCNYDEDLDGVAEPYDIDPNDPYSDSDGDGIADVIETGGDGSYDAGIDTNPLEADTDGDNFEDGIEDTNKNGVYEAGESNPLAYCNPINTAPNCDFDNDGIANQADFDDDDDGVSDAEDADPFNPNSDTDGDSLTDIEEKGSSNPLNACDPVVSDVCEGIDMDGDGYFGNYPNSEPLYDIDDNNYCVPNESPCSQLAVTITSGKDAYIKENKGNKNYGKRRDIHLKAQSGEQERGIIQFDLTNHPGIIINQAILRINLDKGEGSGNIVVAHKITTAWEEGIKVGHSGEVNWEYAKNGQAWTNPGGDFDNINYGNISTESKGWKETEISTALVQSWIDNPNSNHGLMLVSTQGDASEHIEFHSFDGPADKRPQLQLVYTITEENNMDANQTDTDGDGIYDEIEMGYDGQYDASTDTDPNNPDTDGDGLLDGQEDANKNGVFDMGESNPREKCDPYTYGQWCDFDGDGWVNIFDWDDDNDGLSDSNDSRDYDPHSDTDDDGLTDLAEKGSSNPLDPCDPIPNAAACIGTDNDYDGYYTGIASDDPQYDIDDNNECEPAQNVGACICPNNVDDDGKLTICLETINLTWQTHSRDFPYFQATYNASCGPCSGN